MYVCIREQKSFTFKSGQLTYSGEVVTLEHFSLKRGLFRKQNLKVSFVKVILCVPECFQQKMTEIVKFK